MERIDYAHKLIKGFLGYYWRLCKMEKMAVDRFLRTIHTIEKFIKQSESLLKASKIVTEAIKNGNKLLFCGNGGSASQAQHFAAEFVIRYSKNRAPIPAISITSDTSVLTAGANDFGFESIFERQIEALGNKNDVLIAISTSGKSKNVNRAVVKAYEKEMKIIYLCGELPPETHRLCDVLINVPSRNTAIIQEIHEIIGHTLVELVEKELNYE